MSQPKGWVELEADIASVKKKKKKCFDKVTRQRKSILDFQRLQMMGRSIYGEN